MTSQNDANNNPKAEVFFADVDAETSDRLQPVFNCTKRLLLLTSLLLLLILASVVGVTLWALLPQTPENDDLPSRYNLTMRHLTDGKEPLYIINDVVDGTITQDNPKCTHVNNADYTSSSSYSHNYRALRAFQGPQVSWSSEESSQTDFKQQWINVDFEQPTKVKTISFQGDPSNPENSPTVYELLGKDLTTNSWMSVMTARHPYFHKHQRRSHEVSVENRRKFKEYRLVIHQTIWLERGRKKGYVQVSYLEMCWG